MEMTIDQPCPSCGAAITLQEDDRLIRCQYCDVPNFRVNQKLPRYVLPPRLPADVAGDSVYYIPYLRFKGCVYSIQGGRVLHRLVDTTRVGCGGVSMPVSLGLRPQAMAVTPVTEQLEGHFIRQTVKTSHIFSEATKLAKTFTEDRKRPILHRAFIGETLSRVYLPVYRRHGKVMDGVSLQQLGPEENLDTFSSALLPFTKSWEPQFISTLCPHCGDVMVGSRETLVVACEGCDRRWREEGGTFIRQECFSVPAKETESHYLPFWRITAGDESGSLATLADFFEMTNQPLVVRNHHRQRPMRFFIPAFKLNPALFLQVARIFSVSQELFLEADPTLSPGSTAYPVTMPANEAAESMKTVLVASAVSVKKVLECLPAIRFRPSRPELVYLPFRDAGHDMVEQYSGAAISKAALRFGRKL